MRNLLVILFSMFAVSVYAQISRTIYGIELGSGIDEAKAVLEAKGLTMSSAIESKDGVMIGAINPYFTGLMWDLVMVSTINGKVYGVTFSRKSSDVAKEGTDALDLQHKLTEKYGKYEVTSESGQKESYDGFDFQYVMIDDSTRLTLFSEIHKYSQCSITLGYIDKELRKIVESKSVDEL